jgi:hypothetical protein
MPLSLFITTAQMHRILTYTYSYSLVWKKRKTRNEKAPNSRQHVQQAGAQARLIISNLMIMI